MPHSVSYTCNFGYFAKPAQEARDCICTYADLSCIIKLLYKVLTCAMILSSNVFNIMEFVGLGHGINDQHFNSTFYACVWSPILSRVSSTEL